MGKSLLMSPINQADRRMANIRGVSPSDSPSLLVIAAYVQHTGCNLAELGFSAGVNFDRLLIGTRFEDLFSAVRRWHPGAEPASWWAGTATTKCSKTSRPSYAGLLGMGPRSGIRWVGEFHSRVFPIWRQFACDADGEAAWKEPSTEGRTRFTNFNDFLGRDRGPFQVKPTSIPWTSN